MAEASMSIYPKLIRSLLGDVTSDLRGLLFPRYQRELICSYRAGLIINRVRLIAFLFAILTPLWAVLDVIYFPSEIWLKLMLGRMVASLAFMSLSLMYRSSESVKDAYLAMALMFLIPTVFFFYSHFVFMHAEREFTEFAVSFVTGYAFLPFVMATGLSVFPLTAFEGAVFVMPTIMVQLFIGQKLGGHLIAQEAHFGLVWLLLLIASVAILASMGQLHFLSEIVHKSSRDPLTGAYNRNNGEEMLERYYLLATRNHSPLSLLFIDLDDFKSINDEYGHDAGDRALRNASKAINEAIRKEDMLIRWGGEEFVVVLPQTSDKGAYTLLKRLRKVGLGLRPDNQPLSASIGLAEQLKDQVGSLSELIELADKRMYEAKQSGKNRLVTGRDLHELSAVKLFT